eukprot:COSAG05_NODE_521_length_9023_cov_12.169655_8_plen_75_part_00
MEAHPYQTIMGGIWPNKASLTEDEENDFKCCVYGRRPSCATWASATSASLRQGPYIPFAMHASKFDFYLTWPSF